MLLKNILPLCGFVLTTFSFNNSIQAQTYKPNQVVSVGGGEAIKIVKCKGEGATQECEVKHLVNNKQVGNPFWLPSASIAIQQKTYLSKSIAARTKSPVVNRASVKTKTGVAPSQADKRTLAKLETSLTQADMLALAKAAAEQYQPPVVVVEEKKPVVQPKKEKKEFVSHNPYLLKQYKAGEATAKQSPEPGKE
jgi:hypothetical protein